MKTHSPLLGFNNNIQHRGRQFHIQTEDSGIKHPHVITHLFADGGRILKTTKSSYAEHVGSDRLAEVVRDMMKEQHKSMLIALRDGAFDHLLSDVEPAGARAPLVASGTPATPPASAVQEAPTVAFAKPAAGASPAPKADKAPPARYVASRPAAVFANTSPEAGGSIFGDDLISEKSLDEVILSYLSDDLESPPAKKR